MVAPMVRGELFVVTAKLLLRAVDEILTVTQSWRNVRNEKGLHRCKRLKAWRAGQDESGHWREVLILD